MTYPSYDITLYVKATPSEGYATIIYSFDENEEFSTMVVLPAQTVEFARFAGSRNILNLEINDNPVNLDELTFEVEAGKTYILKYSLYPEYDTDDTM